MSTYLTHQIAQEIVDRTMAILPYNINVMDQEGKIIGSGDPIRIFTKHEVASEVIQRKEVIEIASDDIEHLIGVREGINLPILFQDEVLGVVGITGTPEEVRGYGQLVKMTAEMILEQSFLLNQLQLDKRINEEIVHQLINGKDLDESSILEKARVLKLDLTVPRVIVVIKSEKHSNQKLEQLLVRIIDGEDLLLTTYTGEVIILKKVFTVHGIWDKNRTLTTLRIWASQLKKGDPTGKIAIGNYYSNYKELHKSYEEARETLNVGAILDPLQTILLFEKYSLYVMINQLSKFIENNPFFHVLAKFKQQDEMGDLQKTLEIYIKESGKMNNTSNQLHIHRNSLQYRLEKIKEITGKDPRNYEDLFELHMSMIIDKLSQKSNSS